MEPFPTRRAIGVEVDEKYCQLALKRIKDNLEPIKPARKSPPLKKS